MDPEFWHARWHENRIGFHKNEVNELLRRYFTRLAPPPESTVFVPLCGKSLDLFWLRDQGCRVLGVELSPLAVEALYNEQAQVAARSGRGDFLQYAAADVTILLGDYFALTAAITGPIGAVYDRAALIALPPEDRPPYARQMTTLLAPGTRMLLIAPFSPKDPGDGPPFAVSGTEIQSLYGADFAIEVLECERQTAAEDSQLMAQGLAWREDGVYLLTRRP
ncbi:MAG: thiopurine S-methyltransferase [Acidiferrobacter sp.]